MGEHRGVTEIQGVKYRSCQHVPRVLRFLEASFKLARDYERMMQRVIIQGRIQGSRAGSPQLCLHFQAKARFCRV